MARRDGDGRAGRDSTGRERLLGVEVRLSEGRLHRLGEMPAGEKRLSWTRIRGCTSSERTDAASQVLAPTD